MRSLRFGFRSNSNAFNGFFQTFCLTGCFHLYNCQWCRILHSPFRAVREDTMITLARTIYRSLRMKTYERSTKSGAKSIRTVIKDSVGYSNVEIRRPYQLRLQRNDHRCGKIKAELTNFNDIRDLLVDCRPLRSTIPTIPLISHREKSLF